MSKYDCSKTLDYAHEKKRMCASYEKCRDGCRLFGQGCVPAVNVSQDFIDIVQEWSEEHPIKTRAEAFYEMFPNAAGIKEIPVICYQNLINKDEGFCEEDYKCKVCWNQPYKGEFEEAREE